MWVGRGGGVGCRWDEGCGGGAVGRRHRGIGRKSSRRSAELDFEHFINLCRSETYATWVSVYESVVLAYGESNEFNEGEYRRCDVRADGMTFVEVEEQEGGNWRKCREG